MTEGSRAGAEELDRFLAEHPDTEHIDGIFVDVCGIVRGKRYPVEDAAKLYRSGMQIPLTVHLLDVTGDSCDPGGRGFSDGDPDGTAFPMPGTLVPVPWSPHPAGQVMMGIEMEDGVPSPFDPRNVAAGVLARFAELGLTPVVAFELEFYLFDRAPGPDGAPVTATSPRTGARETTTQVYGIWELDAFRDVFHAVARACEVQGVPASVASKEFAPGQYEINLRHQSDPLVAADHAALLRHAVRSVAIDHGLRASFLAKPFADQVGSGMHLHISVVDEDGNNVFADESELGSPRLGHAVAGMQATMAEAMAIFSPHVNAFRRYGLNMFTPLNRSWGANNRSLTYRIPAGLPDARRIEHRIASADANPYLVLAAALAGAHHGLVNELDPGPTTSGNAGERRDDSIPFTMPTALQRLGEAKVLPDYLSREYLDLYRELKQGELDVFNERISPLEYEWYL